MTQEQSYEFIENYLQEVKRLSMILTNFEYILSIANLVNALVEVRENKGRVFICGVGGSAGNASHLVNDFRKINHIECYAPSDNVSELTARINDEGWEDCYSDWLQASKFNEKDAVLILSVGGGDPEKKVSMNLVSVVDYALACHGKVFGIVGRNGGWTAKRGTNVIIVPTVNSNLITPHTEAFQMVLGHLISSHPKLKQDQTKWEGIQEQAKWNDQEKRNLI